MSRRRGEAGDSSLAVQGKLLAISPRASQRHAIPTSDADPGNPSSDDGNDSDSSDSGYDTDELLAMLAERKKKRTPKDKQRRVKSNTIVARAPVDTIPFHPLNPWMTAMPLSMPMPVLKSRLDLPDHLMILNQSLEELGYVVNGEFKPGMVMLVRNLVNDSLKEVPEVHRFSTGPGKMQLRWKELQALLVQEFASVHHIKSEIDTKLKNLTYQRPASTFISAIRDLYHLHRLFYTANPDSIRQLVNKIIQVLPRTTSSHLIRHLFLINPDWEIAMPFAEGPGRTFISVLEQQLSAAQTIAEVLGEQKPNRSPSDRVNFVEPKKKEPWLESWCQKFQGVIRCHGPSHREEVEQLVGRDRTLEAKFFPNGKKGPYCLIGFNGSAPTLKCANRPFTAWPSRELAKNA